MTFAEFVMFLAAAIGLYFVLRPLHFRLEKFFYRFFRSRPGKQRTVIDITDSLKNRDKKE